jgi:hypothetical protein
MGNHHQGGKLNREGFSGQGKTIGKILSGKGILPFLKA